MHKCICKYTQTYVCVCVFESVCVWNPPAYSTSQDLQVIVYIEPRLYHFPEYILVIPDQLYLRTWESAPLTCPWMSFPTYEEALSSESTTATWVPPAATGGWFLNPLSASVFAICCWFGPFCHHRGPGLPISSLKIWKLGGFVWCRFPYHTAACTMAARKCARKPLYFPTHSSVPLDVLPGPEDLLNGFSIIGRNKQSGPLEDHPSASHAKSLFSHSIILKLLE